jgi:hypothetical protein
MRYLCGCNVENKENYRTEYDSLGVRITPTADGVRICPEHGEKIEGWRTSEAIRAGQLTKAGGA